MPCAGFWKRAAARLIDGILLVPALAPVYLYSYPNSVWRILIIPWAMIPFVYSVVLHAYWGQTAGKKAVGIYVCTANGGRLSWKHAILRCSVEGGLAFVSILGFYMATLSVAEFCSGEWAWVEYRRQRVAERPHYVALASYTLYIWYAVSIGCVLLDGTKRAVHDFLAGTIVVSRRAELKGCAPGNLGKGDVNELSR